jgi:hypothetical protein
MNSMSPRVVFVPQVRVLRVLQNANRAPELIEAMEPDYSEAEDDVFPLASGAPAFPGPSGKADAMTLSSSQQSPLSRKGFGARRA